MPRKNRNLALAVASAIAAAALPGAARAAVITWTGAATNNANWNNAANWDAGAKPDDVARFVGGFASTTGNVANNGAQWINQLFYDGVTNAFSINNSANSITLNAGGTAGGVGILRQDGAAPAAAAQVINTSLVLGASQTFDVGGAGGQLTIGGVISETPDGPKDLTKSGGRPLELNAANTFSGQVTVLRNTIIVGHAQALGAGAGPVLLGDANAVTFQSNLLLKNGVTFARDVVVRSGSSGTATLGGNTNAIATWAGNVHLNRPVRFTGSTNAAGIIDFTGVIQDAAAALVPGNPFVASDVTKVDPSTVKLAGANTYTGATNVNAGRLEVNGSLSDAAATVTVNAGGTLGGTGSISRPVVVKAGGILSPGSSPGTLTISGGRTLAFEEGTVIEWEPGDSVAADSVEFLGTPTIKLLDKGGTIDPSATFTLLNWTGPADPSAQPQWLIDPASPLTGTITYDLAANQVVVSNVVANVPEPTTALSFAVGALGALLRRRRRP